MTNNAGTGEHGSYSKQPMGMKTSELMTKLRPRRTKQ
jgi:hypothetical protein